MNKLLLALTAGLLVSGTMFAQASAPMAAPASAVAAKPVAASAVKPAAKPVAASAVKKHKKLNLKIKPAKAASTVDATEKNP